jgi:hypothetical protein
MKASSKTADLAVIGVGLLAFTLVVDPPRAHADTITISFVNVTAGNVFNYSLSEDAAGKAETGATPNVATTPFASLGSQYADYFTIYDFVGFTGVHSEPPDWAFLSQNVGPTDSSIIATDSATIANLTWYYTGSSIAMGPFSLAGFSAQSNTTVQNSQGEFSSEDTHQGGPNDNQTNAAHGTIVVPAAAVPDEASTVTLLGIGLLGLYAGLRSFERRKKA